MTWFTLSDEKVLGPPVNQLTVAILRDVVVANRESNSDNWLVVAAQSYSPHVVEALVEGWAWLYQIGLVAGPRTVAHARSLIRDPARTAGGCWRQARVTGQSHTGGWIAPALPTRREACLRGAILLDGTDSGDTRTSRHPAHRPLISTRS